MKTSHQTDDLKMLRVDYNIVSIILDDTDIEFGNITKTAITQGKIHKFICMTIDYSSSGKVILSMVDYIRNMLGKIPEDMSGESATPSVHLFFDIAEDATKLS